MKISNEEIDQLPLAQFSDDIVVVESQEAMLAAIAEIEQAAVVGFDTETRPSFTRGTSYKVALLQISTESRTWLFRLCKIGMPVELANLMANPAILKVGLAIHDDLRALIKRHTFTPQNCVDLQTLAREAGIEELSLKKMAAQVLGVRISKRQRLTNWENDVLTTAQMHYAATDSWVSLLMYNAFQRGEFLHPRLAAIREAGC